MLKKTRQLFLETAKNPRAWVLALCMAIGIAGIGIHANQEAQASTAADLIRLHVIADSDSPYDQEVKLLVRNSVVEFLETLLVDAVDKEQARKVIAENIASLTETANNTLAQYVNYHAVAMLGKAEFPTKSYGDLILPAGEYDALRIVLGSGEGKNWWCVIFPPLCFVDAAGNIKGIPKVAEASTGSSFAGIQIKWKIIDLLRKEAK